MDEHILIEKTLRNMDNQILTLEIQLAQIQNDSAARGSMVALELLRKELLILKKLMES